MVHFKTWSWTTGHGFKMEYNPTGKQETSIQNNIEYYGDHYTVWHSRLWSFKRRDTKLERFLAKNQLYSNEITKF